MTARDKGELITYINYLTIKGQEARRTARKPGLSPAMSQWLSGCGNARLQIAEELTAYLEAGEVERRMRG